jgi:phosphate transport system protein
MFAERKAAYWEHRILLVCGQLQTMGALTLRQLNEAVDALVQGNIELADRVERQDDEVDEYQKQIDELVVGFVSTHSPAAADCRQLLMAMKIVDELEEIADQATTIARRARDLKGCPACPPVAAFGGLVARVPEMVSSAMRSFQTRDAELARRVIERDDEVDVRYAEGIGEIQSLILGDRARTAAALHWLTIFKALERAGDRAANIAEAVVFWVEGDDIRHVHRTSGG